MMPTLTGLVAFIAGTKVTAYSVHPGYVETDICRHLLTPNGHFFWKLKIGFSRLPFIKQAVWRSAEHGAQTTIFCSIAPELNDFSGGYYRQVQRFLNMEEKVAHKQ